MDKIIYLVKGLYDSGKAVKKVVNDVEKSYSPICIRVINSHFTTNEIEFYNSSDTELMDVHVEILGTIKEDCLWDSPDEKVLSIPFLKPQSSLVVNLLYINSQSELAEFKCTWKNWRHKELSQTTPVQLLGWQ